MHMVRLILSNFRSRAKKYYFKAAIYTRSLSTEVMLGGCLI